MKTTSKDSLHQSLLHAISLYDDSLDEEQGGFILRKKIGDDFSYKFVSVTNQNTGTSIARALYIAEPIEFGQKVALPVVDEDYEIFASYHTHPKGMRAIPSMTDVTKLFTSFPVNYIYAPRKELNRFDYGGHQGQGWIPTNIMSFYGFNSYFRDHLTK